MGQKTPERHQPEMEGGWQSQAKGFGNVLLRAEFSVWTLTFKQSKIKLLPINFPTVNTWMHLSLQTHRLASFKGLCSTVRGIYDLCWFIIPCLPSTPWKMPNLGLSNGREESEFKVKFMVKYSLQV